MKVEKDEFFIDGGKSAMMTMRRRSLADRSRLELRQPEGHGCHATVDSLMGGATRRLVLADRRARRPGTRSATATRGPRYRCALS